MKVKVIPDLNLNRGLRGQPKLQIEDGAMGIIKHMGHSNLQHNRNPRLHLLNNLRRPLKHNK